MGEISDILLRRTIPARIQDYPGIFHVAFGASTPVEAYRHTSALDRACYVRFTTAAGGAVPGFCRLGTTRRLSMSPLSRLTPLRGDPLHHSLRARR
jgi:hypothetical protein